MFCNKSYSGDKRGKNGQNLLSPEEKEQEMNSSVIALGGIVVMVIVFAIIGFVAMWRERRGK